MLLQFYKGSAEFSEALVMLSITCVLELIKTKP